jgi:hypothetical protein
MKHNTTNLQRIPEMRWPNDVWNWIPSERLKHDTGETCIKNGNKRLVVNRTKRLGRHICYKL